MENNTAPEKKQRKWKGRDACGGVYGMAFLGALVYFIQQADTFWQGVLGLLKACFWPAVIMYEVLGLLNL